METVTDHFNSSAMSLRFSKNLKNKLAGNLREDLYNKSNVELPKGPAQYSIQTIGIYLEDHKRL